MAYYRYPRRTCHTCGRDVAIPGGRYSRHDPPHPYPRRDLTSCAASLTPPPPLPGHPVQEPLPLILDQLDILSTPL